MTYHKEHHDRDVIVVGGGLAGMTTGALLARAGQSVLVLEQAKAFGGRAATQVRDDVSLNLGAHALYKAGDAVRLLRDLDVRYTGSFPSPKSAFLLRGSDFHAIPASLFGFLGTKALGWRDKWRFARFHAGLGRVDARALDRISLADWLGSQLGTGAACDLARTFFRVATYTEDPTLQSAGAAVDQLRRGLG